MKLWTRLGLLFGIEPPTAVERREPYVYPMEAVPALAHHQHEAVLPGGSGVQSFWTHPGQDGGSDGDTFHVEPGRRAALGQVRLQLGDNEPIELVLNGNGNWTLPPEAEHAVRLATFHASPEAIDEFQKLWTRATGDGTGHVVALEPGPVDELALEFADLRMVVDSSRGLLDQLTPAVMGMPIPKPVRDVLDALVLLYATPEADLDHPHTFDLPGEPLSRDARPACSWRATAAKRRRRRRRRNRNRVKSGAAGRRTRDRPAGIRSAPRPT